TRFAIFSWRAASSSNDVPTGPSNESPHASDVPCYRGPDQFGPGWNPVHLPYCTQENEEAQPAPPAPYGFLITLSLPWVGCLFPVQPEVPEPSPRTPCLEIPEDREPASLEEGPRSDPRIPPEQRDPLFDAPLQ